MPWLYVLATLTCRVGLRNAPWARKPVSDYFPKIISYFHTKRPLACARSKLMMFVTRDKMLRVTASGESTPFLFLFFFQSSRLRTVIMVVWRFFRANFVKLIFVKIKRRYVTFLCIVMSCVYV